MKQTVDVIALYTKEGKVIPLRLRLIDEEGERREFTIRSYRQIEVNDTKTMSDGMYVTANTLAFECYIDVAGIKRLIRLYWRDGSPWEMTDGTV